HLSAVEISPSLEAVLDLAQAGTRRGDLAARLLSDEIDQEEALGFIDDLIDAQVLVPDLGVELTGRGPAQSLVERLRAIPDAAPFTTALNSVVDRLRNIDRSMMGNDLERYQEIVTTLEQLPAPIERARLFQVDLIRPDAGTLGPAVLAEVE